EAARCRTADAVGPRPGPRVAQEPAALGWPLRGRALSVGGACRGRLRHRIARAARIGRPPALPLCCPEGPTLMNDDAGRSVLVIGGLGFIGINLTRRLVDRGAHVVVLT